MYSGDIYGMGIPGVDVLREVGWGGSVSPERRWEGCHCKVRHLYEYCRDCYSSKYEHKIWVLNHIEEGGFYNSEKIWYYSGGLSYRIDVEEFEYWARPLLDKYSYLADHITVSDLIPYTVTVHKENENVAEYSFLRQIEMFFKDTNRFYCEIWF